MLRRLAPIVVLSALVIAPTTVPAHEISTSSAAEARWGVLAPRAPSLTPFRTAAAAPIAGEGSNMELVANVPIAEASDLELHGDLAFVGSYGEGMVIVDIADPRSPKRLGTFSCGGGSQYDVQLRPDGKYALLTTDSDNATCHEGKEGSMVIDVSDPRNPREVAFIPITDPDGANRGSHTHTLDWPYLYVNQYQPSYHRVEVFNLSDPANPAKVGQLDFGAGQDSMHDSWVDWRPDGRRLLYGASAGATDVIDIADPTKPALLQRIVDPAVTFSHQAESDHDRDTLIVTDEFLGGGEAPFCGQLATGEIRELPAIPLVGNPSDIGAIHFYPLGPDGLIRGGAEGKVGTFNLPLAPNDTAASGCTVHVLWQAPDQDRLVTAWYGRGVRVVDFDDPANPRELGHFVPSGTYMWAAKPHKGFIFTGDLARGMDVLRYTGPGWPANSGPAEQQRGAQQRSFAATAPPPRRSTGRATARHGIRVLRKTVRVPGSSRARRTVAVDILTERGRRLGTARFRVSAGRRVTLRVQVAGRPGRYRYRVRAGARTLASGRVTVKAQLGVSVNLPRGKRLLVTARSR